MDVLFKIFSPNEQNRIKKVVECSKKKCKKELNETTKQTRKVYVKCIKNKKKSSQDCFKESIMSKEVMKSRVKSEKCIKKKCT